MPELRRIELNKILPSTAFARENLLDIPMRDLEMPTDLGKKLQGHFPGLRLRDLPVFDWVSTDVPPESWNSTLEVLWPSKRGVLPWFARKIKLQDLRLVDIKGIVKEERRYLRAHQAAEDQASVLSSGEVDAQFDVVQQQYQELRQKTESVAHVFTDVEHFFDHGRSLLMTQQAALASLARVRQRQEQTIDELRRRAHADDARAEKAEREALQAEAEEAVLRKEEARLKKSVRKLGSTRHKLEDAVEINKSLFKENQNLKESLKELTKQNEELLRQHMARDAEDA